MTRFFTFIAAAATITLTAGTVLADDTDLTINLSEICNPGCVVLLSVEGSRIVNGTYAGEVKTSTEQNPLEAFVGVLLKKDAGIRYTLRDYPGNPSFAGLDQVSKFLQHDNTMVRKARAKTGS